MSVVAGEVTFAVAARKEQVSEQSIGRWKADFLEAGKTALAAGKSGLSTREEPLEADVADLTQALGEAAVELRIWKKSAEGRLGPLEDLEVIRVEAGMWTTRFCGMIDMPERTRRRWQARTRAGGRPKGHGRGLPGRRCWSWPQARVGQPASADRKVWAMVRHDGHVMSKGPPPCGCCTTRA